MSYDDDNLTKRSDTELLQLVLDILNKKDTTDQDMKDLYQINGVLSQRAIMRLKFGDEDAS